MVVMGNDEEMAVLFEMRRREVVDDDDGLPALDEIDGNGMVSYLVIQFYYFCCCVCGRLGLSN